MNQEIKGNLARLLATENLIVEHLKVSTASFDVDRRVLTLPNWDRASSIVYDMLVGHEVGHALFTPNEDWRDIADCPKDYVNVIEDARIEKLMKRKYPGLRKSFAGGYRELNDQDFFGVDGEDLNTFSLIDRINLHFKIGASAMIPFSIEEKLFVARTDLAETFEEVLQIAIDVHQFSNKVETPMTHEEMLEEADKRENANSEDTDTEQSNNERPYLGEDETNYHEVIEEDYSENETDDEISSPSGGVTSKTQRSFDSASKQLTNKHVSNPRYIEIPEKINLENYIVDWSELHNWIDTYREGFLNCDNSQWDRSDSYELVDQSYTKFRKESQKEVNYLVKEFECRKSADAYARSGQSKTGVLDTSKLHTYKYNEDLFKKVTVIPDGKNHGLLFVLDWSGSMSNEILATVKQVLNLTAFCKKVQIPFEVYLFTNEWCIAKRIMSGEDTGYYYYSPENYRGTCNEGEVFLHEGRFHMLNVISSRSNSKNYERMCLNLFREAFYFKNHVPYHNTPGVGLSGTPLNEAIVMMNYIIPNFKSANDIQKVNVCILTDGESCQASYGRKYYDEVKEENYVRPTRVDYNVILRDRKTGRVYNNTNGWCDMTNVLIKQVRDRNYGVNVLGFRIMPGSALSNFVSTYGDSSQYELVQKQWRKTKSAVIPFPKSYTALYAISSNSIDTETEFDVESGAKKGEISRAFKKMLKSKSTNKKLLNSFVEHVA
tara:strand:- start:498 stop:2651 length:2154 start_codon:yes stop_codon:yes gene_type:complete